MPCHAMHNRTAMFCTAQCLFYSWPASDLTSKCLLSHPSGSAAVSVPLPPADGWLALDTPNTSKHHFFSYLFCNTVQYSTEQNKPATEHLTSSQALQNCEVKPQDNFTCILRLILNFLQNSLATLYGGLLWSWASSGFLQIDCF